MILFISKALKAVDEFRTAIEFPFCLDHASSVKEATHSLQNRLDEYPFMPIIVLNAANVKETISACRRIRKNTHLASATILVVRAEQSGREDILAAGADDILHYPYVPVEVQNRLCKYLELCFLKCVNIKTSQAFGEGVSGKKFILDMLGILNSCFCASGVWMYFFYQQAEDSRILDFHSPDAWDDNFDRDEVTAFLREAALQKNTTVEMLTLPAQNLPDNQAALPLGLFLSVPLHWPHNEIIGSLYFRFTESVNLSNAYAQLFLTLREHLSGLMTMAIQLLRGEISTALTGFVGLISKMISQETDPQRLISHTLDQIVALLNATMGCVWMKNDFDLLDMVSSLSAFPIQYTPIQVDSDRGLIGRVVESGKAIWIDSPHKHPDFDPAVDQWHGSENVSVLAVPMKSGGKVHGVLALYHERNQIITDQDVAVVESIAGLCASRIATIKEIEALRESSDQLQALYEMGQHIASGLETEAVFNRTLQWVLRLVESEIGLLWLMDEQEKNLKLVATLGMELMKQEMVSIPSDLRPFKDAIEEGMPQLIDSHTDDTNLLSALRNLLGIDPRNVVLLPIRYRESTIGLLGLVNKIGGAFLDTELSLLLSAVDMIAIAVGNARLHTRTLTLMDEREKAHTAAIQRTRLATIGRLTASLSHEINNPMQAIRGALALALEDLNDQEALVEYLNMCVQESDRVVQLVARMRRIYRPSRQDSQSLCINDILTEVYAMAQKESNRQGVTLQTELAPDLPEVTAIADQLQIVFLNLVLTLGDAIAESGGGNLILRSLQISSDVCVEFEANQVVPHWERAVESEADQAPTELGISVSICQEIIRSLGGTMELLQSNNASTLSIKLPAQGEKPTSRTNH